MPFIHLKTNTGNYLSRNLFAAFGFVDKLHAGATNKNPLTRFELVDYNDAPLMSGDKVALLASNGMYVCAEGGGGGVVGATREWAREWETFTIEKVNAAQPEITNGDAIALRAYNGLYVCAENGGGGKVVANRAQVGPWETFALEIPGLSVATSTSALKNVPMKSVRVELINVTSNNPEGTEDSGWFGSSDEFYLSGVVAAGDISRPVITNPLDIDDGQTREFPAAEAVLFEGLVREDVPLHIGLKAYDQDSGKTWDQLSGAIDAAQGRLNAWIDGRNPLGSIAPPTDPAPSTPTPLWQKIANYVIDAIQMIGSLDDDDLLGTLSLDIPVANLAASQNKTWDFKKSGTILGYSDWSYTVRYRIMVQ